MNKKCDSCNDHFQSDGEKRCPNCRVKSYDLNTRIRDHSKNVKAWNVMANKSNSAVIEFYSKPCPKPSKRYVSSDLSVHSFNKI